MTIDQLEQLVAAIFDGIVDSKYEVHYPDEEHVELYFAKADIGKVIGKGGRTASAIRRIFRGFSEAKGGGRRISVEMKERIE
ncbi:MAG: KH domain-containing protein [Oscillospiraceae bacterium]|jgi:predicted RNA-binding protein YlqC (UPF0109 family)|nr:KH domain-containing protein [Oscillospiraceae bacterium]